MNLLPDIRGSWASLRRPLRYAVGFALILTSSIYVYDILDESFGQLAKGGYALTAANWCALLFGILGTLALSTLYHVLATRRIEPNSTPEMKIGLGYALGQIVRYLPGKVVGVLFQIKFLSGLLRASTITLALIVQMLYDYAWTFAFSGSILLCGFYGSLWPLLALPPVGLLIWRSHVHGWCERGLLFVDPGRRLFGQQQVHQLKKPPHSGLTTLVLLGEWIPMLLGIGIALRAALGLPDALLLGAIYLVASIASLLVVVIPSGLVVREALFVWLGLRYGFEPPMLVFLGLVLRAAMTLAEALNVVLFFAADALQRRFFGHSSPATR